MAKRALAYRVIETIDWGNADRVAALPKGDATQLLASGSWLRWNGTDWVPAKPERG